MYISIGVACIIFCSLSMGWAAYFDLKRNNKKKKVVKYWVCYLPVLVRTELIGNEVNQVVDTFVRVIKAETEAEAIGILSMEVDSRKGDYKKRLDPIRAFKVNI